MRQLRMLFPGIKRTGGDVISIWKDTEKRTSVFFRLFGLTALSLRSNFGDGLTPQSEFRAVALETQRISTEYRRVNRAATRCAS